MIDKDKKFLAEWMGDAMPTAIYDERNMYDIVPKDREYMEFWNPDINHEQFKEVFNRLPTHMGISLIRRFGVEKNPQKYCDIILNNLPKVMDAVMEVIRLSDADEKI